MYIDKNQKEIEKIKVSGASFAYKTAHFHQHSDVICHLSEAFKKALPELELVPIGETYKTVVDLGRVIGHTACVALTGNEEIFYAQRKGRKTLTKFVKGIDAPECSTISFVLHKSGENKYRLITAYIGKVAEKEPLDPKIENQEEFNIAKTFWDNHALIEGTQKIYLNTVTTECPWDKYDNRISLELGNNNNIKGKILAMREKRNVNNSQTIDDKSTLSL